MEYVTVYLVKYFDLIKDKEDYIIVYMKEDIEVISHMCEQIFYQLYPNDIYQGEINIISCEKLYVTSKDNLLNHKAYPFMEIKDDTDYEIDEAIDKIKIKEKYKYLADYAKKLEDE